MKAKGLLAIFAAFTMSATIFAVGCENFNLGGGSLLRPGPSFGNGDRDKTDDTDDDVPSQGQINSKPIPEFNITLFEKDGWAAHGQITALSDTRFVPGMWGQDSFIIKSECKGTLGYNFTLSEIFDDGSTVEPFIQYRIKLNGVYLDDDWHYAGVEYGKIELAAGSEQILTLDYQYPFADIDESTYENLKGKQLSVNISIWGEEYIYIG